MFGLSLALSLSVFLFSVERPDLDLTATTVPVIEAITNLYGYPATIDFYVASRRVGEPVVAAETALLAANKDIVSFPVAASAVVPVYNLPGVPKAIPLLLTRQVRHSEKHAAWSEDAQTDSLCCPSITRRSFSLLFISCLVFHSMLPAS